MEINRKNVFKVILAGLFAGSILFMIVNMGAGLMGLAVLLVGLAFILNDGWLE